MTDLAKENQDLRDQLKVLANLLRATEKLLYQKYGIIADLEAKLRERPNGL